MKLLRVAVGLAGGFIVVYFVGGTIGNAVAGQLHWQTILFPLVGVVFGAILLGYAFWGGRPGVTGVCRRALLTGIIVAALGAIPGLVLLGTMFGGVLPHFIVAVAVLPGLFIVGAVVGGAIGFARISRQSMSSEVA